MSNRTTCFNLLLFFLNLNNNDFLTEFVYVNIYQSTVDKILTNSIYFNIS